MGNLRTMRCIAVLATMSSLIFPLYLILDESYQAKYFPRFISDAVRRIYGPEKEDSYQNLKQGLIIDWWFDVCFQRTTWERIWHPLFPYFPQKTTTTLIAGDKERTVGNFFRRVYGYLHTNQSDFYEFKLLSRDGAEMVLLGTNLTLYNVENYTLESSFESAVELLYMNLTQEIMDEQDKHISLKEMFSTESPKVWLEAGRLYFVELVQGGKHFAKCQLHWRVVDEENFKLIDKENLLYKNDMMLIKQNKPIKCSKFPREEQLIEIFSPNITEKKRRYNYHQIPVLDFSHRLEHSKYNCDPIKPKFRNITRLYDAFERYMDEKQTAVYPQEFNNKTSGIPRDKLILNEEFVATIAKDVFEKLENLHDGDLEFHEIVHVQENSKFMNESRASDNGIEYYFIEIDVKASKSEDDNDKQIYRTSNYVQLLPEDNRSICFISEFQWKHNVEINLITPIRNQKVWLMYLIRMLENVIEKTGEQNVRLILIDNRSTDGDYEQILADSNLPHLYLRTKDGKFNKVKALNYGLKQVANNSIGFILDLHLQLPLNMFDRIRKLTIQGKTAFTPALLKLSCGEHEQYTPLKYSNWLDDGVGMISLYKSDWTKVGGFNEKLFNNKWGGEDWEVLDRMFKHGLEVIQLRMPDFYHIHHTKMGMWNT